MRPSVTLEVIDSAGRRPTVAVNTRRFTIGRDSSNDLVIAAPELSRHHSLIECCDNQILISDGGSQHGTFVNQQPVIGSLTLKDRDVISFGSTTKIIVHFEPVDTQTTANPPSAVAVARSSKKTISVNISILWITALLIGVIVTILIVLKPASPTRPDSSDVPIQNSSDQSSSRIETDTSTSDNTVTENPTVTEIKKDADIAVIEQTAQKVLQRISSDDKPYVFPEQVLNDINSKLTSYCNEPSLPASLRALEAQSPQLIALARRENIEPALLIYTVLARTDGGRTSRAFTEIAHQTLPDLISIKETFGSGLADSSLIVVAAYPLGGGTKKTHPLLATLRRVVKNPLTQRNVWYLRERGELGDNSYNFVINFLTLGIIAQNPRHCGLENFPLSL